MDPISPDTVQEHPLQAPASGEPELSHPLSHGLKQGAARDENQEVDVWWGSYAGRAMLPSFVLCGLLTLAIAVGAWLEWEAFDEPPQLMRYLAYALVTLVWAVQLLRWAYRTVTINYRLTTHRLFRDKGLRLLNQKAVALARIQTVVVERSTFLERLVDVGRIRIVANVGGKTTLVLEAVHKPDQIATAIRSQVERARAQNVKEPQPVAAPASVLTPTNLEHQA